MDLLQRVTKLETDVAVLKSKLANNGVVLTRFSALEKDIEEVKEMVDELKNRVHKQEMNMAKLLGWIAGVVAVTTLLVNLLSRWLMM